MSTPDVTKDYVYKPLKTDFVDVEIARCINTMRDTIHIPVVRLDKGYIIGTKFRAPFMRGSKLVFAVGGGY